MTIQQLKQLKQSNRDNSVIYKLLSTIIGECEQISKDPSNKDILKVMTKIYKDNCSTIAECKNRPESIKDLKIENSFISPYLPQKLSKKELMTIIYSQASNGFKMSEIMKYLSSNYNGQYNGKEAIEIIKELNNDI